MPYAETDGAALEDVLAAAAAAAGPLADMAVSVHRHDGPTQDPEDVG